MAKRRTKLEGYRSYKHPILEHIFNQKTSNGTVGIGQDHYFTLGDIGAAFVALGIPSGDRASYSNFVLDLTRKNAGIQSRLPDSLIALGYDLKKKTGRSPEGINYAGVFVFVGVGNSLDTWLVWPDIPDEQVVIENSIPVKIAPFLGRDEGALFSVIDYCDVLSQAIYKTSGTVLRVQNPMKWQPNEIDGLYFSDYEGVSTLFPIEAKALSTGDDINLEQMEGAYRTISARRPDVHIVSLGIRMIENGMNIAVFEGVPSNEFTHIQVTFDPPIENWLKRSKTRQGGAK